MPDKLNILIIAPYLPSLGTNGCARKVYDNIEALHKRSHNIYLLSFCSREDTPKIEKIKQYCVEISIDYIKNYFHFPARSTVITKKIESLCKDRNIDALQCETAFMSRYIPSGINTPSVLVEHEILSFSFARKAKLINNPIEKANIYIRRIKKLFEEEKWYKKFNKIIVFSKNDSEIIYKQYGINNTIVIPLGLNLKNYPLPTRQNKLYDLIFTGNFGHSPNTDAVLYFLKHIFKLIKDKIPDISIAIIGDNVPESIKKLSRQNKNILITGYVKNIIEYYHKSRIAIVPLRYGTGMRFKILEALALNVPVVSTSVGANGLISKYITIADTAGDFADKIIHLLINPRNNNNTPRDEIEKHHNWDVLLREYEKVYLNLLN